VLCTLHANDVAQATRAEALIREAIQFSPTPVKPELLIQDLID
jgi:hypothetical protein